VLARFCHRAVASPDLQVRHTIAGMLGVHFAMTHEQERSLLSADDDGDGSVGELSKKSRSTGTTMR